jgi:transcriptional regulator with XRE-family HTH domain
MTAKSAQSRHVTRRLPTELIKERRRALSLTQQQAADQAGITRVEWNQMENGKRGVGPKNAPRFVDVLGGTVDDYLTAPAWPAIEELRRELTDLKRRVSDLEARRNVT